MKRFVSLSAAIMLGTVLSKEHTHVAKMIAKPEKPKHKEAAAVHQKKKETDSLDEYRVKIDKETKKGDFKHADLSPKTSVASEGSQN